MKEIGLKRGQPITFRIPSNTSDNTLRQLQELKDAERRNFSSKIAEFVMDGINDARMKHKEVITIPLPKGLTKAQRDWLKHEQSEALLGSIVYQLMADPIRAAALFTSLNSNGVEVNDALYVPEEVTVERIVKDSETVNLPIEESVYEEQAASLDLDDDLDNFDWEAFQENSHSDIEEEEEEVDPLGDFLAQMNK